MDDVPSATAISASVHTSSALAGRPVSLGSPSETDATVADRGGL